MTTTTPKLLTPDEVAALLHCTPATVMQWARAKELPGAKIGRQWLFREADVLAYVEARVTGAGRAA